MPFTIKCKNLLEVKHALQQAKNAALPDQATGDNHTGEPPATPSDLVSRLGVMLIGCVRSAT